MRLAVPLTPPFLIVRLAASFLRDVVFYVETTERALALTLDDGPHPDVTPRVLEVLARHDAHATLFLLGERARAQPELVQRIVDEHHELGNHTWRDERAAGLSRASLQKSTAATHDVLSRHASIRCFRPGGGWPTRRVRAVARENRYDCILGSIYPNDTRVASDGVVIRDVVSHASPGSIVVLHEGTRERARIVTVLDEVLAQLRARGYRVVTVTELLDMASEESARGC